MSIELPSGKNLDYYDQEMFRYMASFGFVRWSEKPFTLKSGIQSHVYVYGREDVTVQRPVLMYRPHSFLGRP